MVLGAINIRPLWSPLGPDAPIVATGLEAAADLACSHCLSASTSAFGRVSEFDFPYPDVRQRLEESELQRGALQQAWGRFWVPGVARMGDVWP